MKVSTDEGAPDKLVAAAPPALELSNGNSAASLDSASNLRPDVADAVPTLVAQRSSIVTSAPGSDSNMPAVGTAMVVGVSIVIAGIIAIIWIALNAEGNNRIVIFGFAAAITTLVGATMRLVAHFIGLGPRRGGVTPARKSKAEKLKSEWDGIGKAFGVMAALYAVSLAWTALPPFLLLIP